MKEWVRSTVICQTNMTLSLLDLLGCTTVLKGGSAASEGAMVELAAWVIDLQTFTKKNLERRWVAWSFEDSLNYKVNPINSLRILLNGIFRLSRPLPTPSLTVLVPLQALGCSASFMFVFS